jgi:hypothetical protein
MARVLHREDRTDIDATRVQVSRSRAECGWSRWEGLKAAKMPDKNAGRRTVWSAFGYPPWCGACWQTKVSPDKEGTEPKFSRCLWLTLWLESGAGRDGPCKLTTGAWRQALATARNGLGVNKTPERAFDPPSLAQAVLSDISVLSTRLDFRNLLVFHYIPETTTLR